MAVGGARTVRAEEVYAHGPEVIGEAVTADVAGVRGRDQAVRVELADQLAELLWCALRRAGAGSWSGMRSSGREGRVGCDHRRQAL